MNALRPTHVSRLFSGSLLLRFVGFLSFVLLAFAPSALRADDTPALPAGRYTLDRTSLRAFEDALTQAVKELPPIPAQRRIALRRLRERLEPPAEIVLASSEAGWALQLGNHEFPAMQPGAEPLAWTSKDGQKAQVSLQWRDKVLEQTVASGDRTRKNAFSFDPAEKVLRVEMRFLGSKLPQPVVFTVRYLPPPDAAPTTPVE